MTTISRIACPPRYGTPRTPDRPTLGGAVTEVARLLGKPLLPWQRHVVDVILEVDPITGRLVYQEFGLTVPRQSGKSTLLLAKAVHRATATKFFGPRQQIVYTAQTRKDARRKWEEDYVEDLKASPTFKPPRAVPHFNNGSEHIRFANRSRFGIESTTEKSGHGPTIDEAYIDEAFAQVDGRMEQAFGPAMITRPNKQLGWISTAGWEDGSPYLKAKIAAGRAQAEMGIREKLAYFEWSAGDDVDPFDRAARYTYMPALGFTIPEDAIDGELDKALREGKLNDYFRAYMNRWVLKNAAQDWQVIPRSVWQSRLDPSPQPRRPQGEIAVGVAVAWPSAEWAAVSVAGRRDGELVVQVVDHRPGTAWVAGRVKELRDQHSPCAIVLDPSNISAAAQVKADLDAAKVDLVTPLMSDVAQAAGLFWSSVCGDQPDLRHYGQPELDAALAAAQKRGIGDKWTWARKGVTDISPLEAVTLAAWGHVTRRLLLPAIY
jgi:hypothetical protein